MFNWSRIISILTIVATILTFGIDYFGGFLGPDVRTLLLGIAAAILAFTERVQGGASKV